MPIIIGIDPAPSAKGHAMVCIKDEQFKIDEKVTHLGLREKIKDWKGKPAILIGWDAPLTGPNDPDDDKASESNKGDFTKRPIESCWNHPKEVWLPKGISVQGYASCQHWTITRNLLGLPRVGKFDKKEKELPFKLLMSRPENWFGQYVVEVHPALAMYLWIIRDKVDSKVCDYRYKGNGSKDCSSAQRKANRERIVNDLFNVWKNEEILNSLWPSLKTKDTDCKKSPDVLDALVAAVLVYVWVKDKDHNTVILLGDHVKGSFLLPNLPNLPQP